MNYKKIKYFGMLLAIAVSICGCEVYHFEKPQPVNEPNLYAFPKEFQGKWQDDNAEATVIVKGTSMRLQGFDSIKVVNQFATQKDTIFRHYLKYIRLNKETQKFDTVTNYVVKGNKIYEVNDGQLESGFPFALKKDTIYFRRETMLDIELNQKAFLRKLSDNRYILNIHEDNLRPLLKGHVGPWWQIVLMELTADHKINFRDISEDVKKFASPIYHNSGDFYFDVVWSKSELAKLADGDLFGKGIEKLHRVSQPIPKTKK